MQRFLRVPVALGMGICLTAAVHAGPQKDAVCQGGYGGGCGDAPASSRDRDDYDPPPVDYEALRRAEEAAALAEQRRQAVSYNNQAVDASDRGDYASALALCQQALAADPDNPTIRANLEVARQNIATAQARAAADREEATREAASRAQLDEFNRQEQAAAARVQTPFKNFSKSMDAAPSSAGLEFAGGTTGDAFGTRKANPKLVPVMHRIGTNTKACDQLRAAAASSDLTLNYDIGGASSAGGCSTPQASASSQPETSTALQRQLPAAALKDPQVQKLLDWDRSLDVLRAEKERMLATLRAQQKSNNDPILAAKVASVAQDVAHIDADKRIAHDAVVKQVAVVKKATINKGLIWDEAPATPIPTPTVHPKPGGNK